MTMEPRIERAGIFSCGCRYRFLADNGPDPMLGCPVHVGARLVGAWTGHAPGHPADLADRAGLPPGALDSAALHDANGMELPR